MFLIEPPRAGQFWIATVFALFALAACDAPSDDGSSQPASYWVSIGPSERSVTASQIELRGSASCDGCPPSDVAFGACPPVHGPFLSSIEITWTNLTTGAEGAALHGIFGHCACLFSTCWVSYEHEWSLTVPLAMGPNVIEVDAFGPTYLPGSETITIMRTPPTPTDLEARAGLDEIELTWGPVAGADSYTVYWSVTRPVTSATASTIPGVTSPFRHRGLADETTLYYAVAAVSSGQEGPLSIVAWATAGWPTAALPVPASATVYADTSLATDALDHVHVHLSQQAPDGASERNTYTTDGAGPWAATQVALTSWRDADVALDATGTVHLSYLRPEGLVHAWGSAGAWSTEVVDARGTCDASLTLDAAERVHLAYRAATTPPELRYATKASGAWLAERVDAADLGCSSGVSMLSLEVEGDGTPHLVYAGAAPGLGLHHAMKLAGLWIYETIEAGAVSSPSLALEADGTAHVAFVDGQGFLRHAHRGGSGAWTSEGIDPEVFLYTPSLVLDAAGHAHVSYFASGSGGELRYATNEGGAWRIVRIAPAKYSDTALALDLHGWLHVAYFDLDGAHYATRR
ncbi:MAG: fibronectin type III domain-containing protein [Planctomycetes bacterium]|nr:fibronectin type III domain-containing protein [Planctomycetota bacterium]